MDGKHSRPCIGLRDQRICHSRMHHAPTGRTKGAVNDLTEQVVGKLQRAVIVSNQTSREELLNSLNGRGN